MKTFTLLLTLLLLNLGVSLGADVTTDCGCRDADNLLRNGGFEAGDEYWSSPDTNFGTDTEYSVCGSKNGIMNGAGQVYQTVSGMVPGKIVKLSVYGGTHDKTFRHTFKLTFYNNSNQIVPIDENGNNTVDMNYQVTQKHKLQQYNLSATVPAGATKVRFSLISNGNYFKVDVACMSVEEAPVAVDCCRDEDNSIKNGSFETEINSTNWVTGGTNFKTEGTYKMCGEKSGLITGSGSVYQDVAIIGGSIVNVSAYGGTHAPATQHLFKLEFYNGNTKLGGDVQTTMDYKVLADNKLKKFTISGTAPLEATKVRFVIYSAGDFFKVDVVCMSLTPPTPTTCTACADAQTVLKNPSLENGTTDWSATSGTNFSSVAKNFACGSKVGKVSGAGIAYQEFAVVPGTAVSLSVYGGVSDPSKTNKFYLVFIDGSGNIISGAHNSERDVNRNALSGLEQYSLSGTAPAGAVKVVFGAYSEGGDLYFDAACMTVTPPAQCEPCDNNRIVNSGFEDGTNNWSSEGTFAATTDAKNCGDKGAKLTGAGKFWQDVTFDPAWGSIITFNVWAAKDGAGTQKFQIFFYDASNKELGRIEKDIVKIFGNAPVGLEKYTLTGPVPEGTKVVRIQGISTDGVLRADGTCMTVSGPSLPVTLATFDVKKEGSTALLRWTTTAETNSDHFDVQHSQDGKNWTDLATIQAQGESTNVISYGYTHTSPFLVNLYRLKMVDLDATFAYSAIRSLNFSGDEEMKIYPNPTSDRIKLTSNQKVSNVKVYDQRGVLVMNTLPDSANEVDLTRLAQGTYFVKINDGASVRKILVVR
ncbi:T9SS type A sorting domain-containing protein [Dyadobacter arcticus]|uniref:Secretion system C-terminal sorting domain-containing protein n=1 Tax=Dyadobacter arcticus TaxID=1078754 RepID=A0ABX0UFP6_9BACT|nr:T9SS type A sorting domain-containing protein [Dyadobacter arcticus]NIJ51833.1 hypothetical protein [Dyadobacter arcticus]